MNRRTTPGLGQWLTVAIVVILVSFLLYKLLQYGGFRQFYPAGLTIAGVSVSGYTRDQAQEILTNRYYNAPIIIFHGENRVEVNPLRVEFELDLEGMLGQADFQKAQQDYWSGFWGFLWGRPVEIESVELTATHNQDALLEVIRVISTSYDQPPQPAQPIPGSYSFQYGRTGVVTDVEASLPDVTAALYRPTDRESFLVLKQSFAERPEINLLARLIVNSTQEFEQLNNGVASVFIYDLETGDEIAINADVAMSGMGMMKLPLAIEAFRTFDDRKTITQTALISETLLALNDDSADALLAAVSGVGDPLVGAQNVTAALQALGLANTFMLASFNGEDGRNRSLETPANSQTPSRTLPTPAMQTTAEDLGLLLTMIYYCAEGTGGALELAFQGAISRAECQELLGYLSRNNIDSLIEQGVPAGTQVAHRHGWVDDTHGDAGIVFTPNGTYVIAQIFYKPVWLEWEISSPIIANISRATYNFFNFDEPYLDNARSN